MSYILNYSSKVDIPEGTMFGPRLDGQYLRVVGSYYDSDTQKTEVHLELLEVDE